MIKESQLQLHKSEMEDLDAMDKAYENTNEMLDAKHSDEIKDEWRKFVNAPASFFSEDNLEKIGSYTSGKRLALLARSSLDITVTPDMASDYFKKFPDDLKSAEVLFSSYRNGIPEDDLESKLFSIIAPEIEKVSRNFPYNTRKYIPKTEEFVESNQYLEIAERRNVAPKVLLEDGNYYLPDDFKKFGKAGEDYFSVLNEAGQLNVSGDHFLDANRIFGEDFKQLSDQQKSEFLRMALVNIHYNMVAEEVYDSAFTKEMVAEDKQRQIDQIAEYGRATHNVAHSMIFKTYQATSVYDTRQDMFEYEMNNTAERSGYLEEYADYRIVLALLGKFREATADKEKNIELLTDYWNKSRNPIFGNAIIEALNEQDVNLSASRLLAMLDQEEDKNHISALLCRLEFGQIGISDKGVKYLENMYDLSELNNSDFFAQRLTAKGDIGVFDDKKVLQKYFNLGDLASQEQVVKPKIHEFVYETLFRDKEGENEEERNKREAYLQEFKENYFDFYDDNFFKETGIRFNNLEFKEQGWFLMYYKESESEKRKELMDFARDFGESGLKSFLSLEYNDSNGDKLLDINKHLTREQVENIFSKYVRIGRIAEDLQSEMKESEFMDNQIMDAKIKNKLRENIYDAFMFRATDILTTAHKIVTEGGAKAEFYNGQEIEVKEVAEVIEALEIYEAYLEKMKGFFTDKGRYQFDFINLIDQDDLSIYNFTVGDKQNGKQSFASLSLRGEGTNEHLENFEYDGEARINFLFSSEYISSHIKDKSRREATTFRLDRECLEFDETGDKVIGKDNTRQDGRLSFDFGSIYEDSGRENTVIGRVISVGNFYTSEEKEKKPEFYHNKESFYKDLGDAKVFKGIAGSVEKYIKSRYVKKAKDKMKEVA